MPGCIKKFAALSQARQTEVIERGLQRSLYNLPDTPDFADIVAGTDPYEWNVEEYELIGEPKIKRHDIRVMLSYCASRSDEHELRNPFYGDLVRGKAIFVIDDDEHLHFEKVTGKIRQSSTWKRERTPGKDSPVGSLEWENYWVYKSWKLSKTGSGAKHITINGHEVAVGEDKFADGFRYGVETVPGTDIKWNTWDLFATEYEARRAALKDLARILLR